MRRTGYHQTMSEGINRMRNRGDGDPRLAEHRGKAVWLRCGRCRRRLARLAPDDHDLLVNPATAIGPQVEPRAKSGKPRLVARSVPGPGEGWAMRYLYECAPQCGRQYTLSQERLVKGFLRALAAGRSEILAGIDV
jgi:hypothetical protein